MMISPLAEADIPTLYSGIVTSLLEGVLITPTVD
jgi:hypothetical protein